MTTATATRIIPTAQVTVTTKLKVNCGCTFSTDSLEEAERHSAETAHTLHITGQISSR